MSSTIVGFECLLRWLGTDDDSRVAYFMFGDGGSRLVWVGDVESVSSYPLESCLRAFGGVDVVYECERAAGGWEIGVATK